VVCAPGGKCGAEKHSLHFSLPARLLVNCDTSFYRMQCFAPFGQFFVARARLEMGSHLFGVVLNAKDDEQGEVHATNQGSVLARLRNRIT
jgi:hypothetical protein